MHPRHRVNRTPLFLFLFLVVPWVLVPAAAAVQTTADWTVMVFMNGSDLESNGMAATADLLEMMRVGSTDRVNVVVETLGTSQWYLDGIDANENQRFVVHRGTGELRRDLRGDRETRESFADLAEGNPRGPGLELVADGLGSRALADPETLADFIVWSMEDYPAERYALILWNHGAGSVIGFGADEQHEYASLSIAGIQQALETAHAETGTALEFVGFDACLMATVEVAHALSPFARYMVASQEIEPGNGWDYASSLGALVADPQMTGAEFGRIVADSYARHSRQNDDGFADIITLSVIDLARTDRVVEALDAFVEAAGAEITADPQSLREFSQAIRRSESYGNGSDESFDMVDLGDLAAEAADAYGREAEAVRAGLTEAIVYSISGRGKADASGLSVWLPYRDREGVEENLAQYLQATPFTPAYREFVETYARHVFAPSQPVRLLSAEPEMHVDEEGDEYYTVTVARQDRDRVLAVDSVLAYADPDHEDEFIILGIVNEALYDEETGEIVQYLPDELPVLNGSPISFFEQNASDTTVEWTVPVLLNGEDVDLVVLLDLETWEGDVIGAWPGTAEDGEVAVKDLIRIRPGDRISPLFPWVGGDEDEVEDTYVHWDEFVVGEDGLTFGWDSAPEGEYMFAFVLTDIHQLETYSDFISVEYSYGR
ncbi:clostripain-related cysteine peptidase [Limnochorda pilosa]|uniref:Peptidase C11 clostripain n=1 Tax=Limnochorda pilosa TaxID=1555112 RepID=A0A0K2SH28_LIMPI|nr:clostripain-related cysteine peptidase [Limnochorda pilosa]BAS26421.1 peptidase C11 clostripain [Limnochorda pilosa]